MAYIEAVEPDDLADELKPDLDLYAKFPGYVPNSFLTLAHKPEIAKAFRNLQSAVASSLTFPAELRLLMWHTMSRAAGNNYTQIHSLHGIVRGGLVDSAKLADLWNYETSPLYSDAERAALDFAKVAGEDPTRVQASHHRALRAHFSNEQIVEMLATLSVGGWMLVWNGMAASDLEELPVSTVEQLSAPKITPAARRAL